MKRSLHLALLALLATTSSAWADSEGPARPVVNASAFGPCFFAMTPRGKGSGAAYELQPDGSFKRLWKTTGWYASGVHLSQDGRYLVRMGEWAHGYEPSQEDLAVAFYDRAKLLAQYSTADLVKDKSKVRVSTGHYRWLANEGWFDPKKPPEPEPQLRDDDLSFLLKTIDGIGYKFDLKTGKILVTDGP